MWRPFTLIVIGGMIYANSLSTPFVFDDLIWIRHDWIGTLWPISSALGDSSRPILNLSLAFNYALGRFDPFGYHLVNVLIHICASLTLYGVARRTFHTQALRERYASRADGLAISAALIWLVHPLATQAVTYVIQRGESMASLFYLLVLYSVIRCAQSERRAFWTFAAISCCALGMGSKEIMVSAPLIALLYDRTFLAGSFAGALRERGVLHAGLAATWGVLWVLLDTGALGGDGAWAGFELRNLSALEYARSQPGVILHYLRLCVWPHPLVLDYGWPVATTVTTIVLPTMLLAGLGGMTLWALWKKPALGFLGACFFAILAPTSSVLPIVDLAFEHRMYLPLAVVLMSGVLIVDLGLRRASAPTWIAGALVVVISVPLSAATLLRNRDYRSARSMWQSVVESAPGNPRGQMNLGVALEKEGDHEHALGPLLTATLLDPDGAERHTNLAVTLQALGRSDEAFEHFRRALEIDPTHGDAHRNLGYMLQQQGDSAGAFAHFRAALRKDSGDAFAHLNLASALLREDDFDESLLHFREATRLNPGLARAHAGAAWILLNHPELGTRNPGEALELAERAASLSERGDSTVLTTLADAYEAAGRRELAQRTREEAQQLRPTLEPR